jgi:hypothetical protein
MVVQMRIKHRDIDGYEASQTFRAYSAYEFIHDPTIKRVTPAPPPASRGSFPLDSMQQHNGNQPRRDGEYLAPSAAALEEYEFREQHPNVINGAPGG